ncbi:MAG: hypothetical protein ACE5EL_06010, partial [Anaerolineae bacterium]
MIHFRIRYEGLRRRLARRRRRVAILRGAWMALVPVALALAVSVVVRQRPSPRVWAPVSLGVLAISGIWIARPRSLREIGHALDSAFGLDDLLVTALEVDRRGPQGALEESLLDDAATALAESDDDRTLSDESRDQPRAARAEHRTQRELLFSRRRPHQREVGDVRARDQEHEP